MKHLLLLVVLLIVFSISNGQNTFPSTGNVGIGTSSPSAPLHVNGIIQLGGTTSDYAISGQDGLGLFIEQAGMTNVRSRIRLQTSRSSDFSSYARLNINAYTGFSFEALGNANGNVGIGTTMPGASLDMINYARILGSPLAARGVPPNGKGFEFTYDNTNDIGILLAYDRDLSRYQKIQLEGATVYFNTASGGNVGIGTSTPSEKLSVNGNIKAKKLIVTPNGWSDYVFHPSYKLQPLSDVEQFIKQNRHLPDIPSEKEVKEKGISVGDNQALLLKKIEELTLYVIEINKKVINLEAENKHLKKHINTTK